MKGSEKFYHRQLFIRALPFCVSFFLSPFICSGQQKVSFYAQDSLKIIADLYLNDYKLPFILLFHQDGSSRGEYKEIAARLIKLDYNCLAVDLRSGDKINYIVNETAENAKISNLPTTFYDAKKDIEATIRYVRKFSQQPIVLFGSSFSASLCLMIAKNNPDIRAIIAFSPGEFFGPEVLVKNAISGITQPIFISTTDLEYEFVMQMLAGVPEQNRHVFKASKGKGDHGAKMLWKSCESSDECWLDMMLFFKKIRFI